MNHLYEQVDGWFNFKDLYDATLAEARDGAVFIEVGIVVWPFRRVHGGGDRQLGETDPILLRRYLGRVRRFALDGAASRVQGRVGLAVL